MPNLRGKTWTTTTPANVGDAQYWEDHLISDAAAAKAASSVQSVNSILPDQNGNVDIGNAGHTIQDDDGNDMPKQDVLQFVNADVTNDTVNDKTVVDCKGAKGDAATITVGTVTTLPAGSDATVTNSGTSSAAVFDFGIPQGEDGAGAVDSVNGKTGTVVLTATDIGALPSDTPVIVTSTTAGLVKNDGTIDTTEYQTKLSFDTVPVKDSTKPVESGGIYDALAPKVSESLLKDTVGWVGKNRLKIPSSVVSSGIYTVNRNSDGEVTSIVANGTPSVQSNFQLVTDFTLDKPMILSGCPSGGSANDYFIYAKDSNNTYYYDFGNGVTLPAGTYSVMQVVTKANITMSNKAFYPMLSDTSLTDRTFEPYHKSVEDWYWENNAKTGVHNIMPDEVHKLSLSSGTVGAATYNADDPAVMFFCKVKQNTDYTISRKASTDANKRFTVVTSVDAPANGVSCNVIYANVNSTSYTFNSGNNNYVALYCGKNLTDTDIEPMLKYAEDTCTDFADYAMTNRELTEKVVLREHTYTGTSDANGVVVASTVPHRPIVYCYGAPTGGGNVFVEARPGGGGIAFYCHNNGAKVASTEITIHYFDYQD